MTPTRLQLQRWQSLTGDQRERVLALHISPEQIEFAGTTAQAVSVCEGASPDEVAGLAILESETPIGFVLLSRGARLPDWAPAGAAALRAMRIDSREQGKATDALRWHWWLHGCRNTGCPAASSHCAWTTRTWQPGAPTTWRGSPSTRNPGQGASGWCGTC